MFESAELLDLLFSLLERPSPLPPVLAGYFAKVVSSLLTRRTADCMLYLQARALASHPFLASASHRRSRSCVAACVCALSTPAQPARVVQQLAQRRLRLWRV